MFHIITYKEGDCYIGKILENNVSSFGNSEKEAYNNTIDALKLFNEGEGNNINTLELSSPKIYSLNLSNA